MKGKCEETVKSLVSVVMPVFNTKEEHFRNAIDSIICQSYRNWELLIVDDASDNYIKKVVETYTDNRIKYYRLETNSGAAIARNYAINNAKGEYIAFLDSDDISLKDRLAKQLDYLAIHQDIGCVATGVEVIGNEKDKIEFNNFSTNFDIESYLIFTGNAFCQSSIMLRKSVLVNNNIKYQSKHVPAEDYGLWLDLIGHVKFAVLPEKLTQYRFYLENISHRQKELQIEKCEKAQIDAFEKYCNIKFFNKGLWLKFSTGTSLSYDELKELESVLPILIDKLKAKGYSEKKLIYTFKKNFKKIYYHSHSIYQQWQLSHSSLNKIFSLPLSWRMFCFITRGFF